MNRGSSLTTDQFLAPGDWLSAPDGSCFLVMQRDGNLCLYDGRGPENAGAFRWGSLGQSLPVGDYFAIMQSDGHFCVYEGKDPQHRGAWKWGTSTVAPGRTFFARVQNAPDASGPNFVVGRGKPDAATGLLWVARRRLRVLTFNAHLMEGSNVVVGAWIKNEKPVCFQDGPRYDLIVRKIRESGADVVAIQEVWAAGWMDRLARDLARDYSFCHMGSKGVSPISLSLDLLSLRLPRHAAGSGILLLSRFPLSELGGCTFEGATDDAELTASKGAIAATVQLPDRSHVRIGASHFWTDAGGDDCRNAVELAAVALRDRPGTPAVLAGDFNIHRRGNPKKLAQLDDIMAHWQLADSWVAANGADDLAGSVTADPSCNTLAEFFSPDRDTEAGDCIDYVYSRGLKPAVARVLRDWTFRASAPQKWYWVHQGSLINMPSAAAFGADAGKLCVATRSADRRLRIALTDTRTRRWTHHVVSADGREVTLSGAPGLVWFEGKLQLFFPVDGSVMKTESTDGVHWSAPVKQGFATSGGVCVVPFKGKLHALVRDPTGGATYCHVLDREWSRPQWVGINTRHDISAAALNDTLCVVTIDNCSGNTGGVMCSRLSEIGAPWRPGRVGHEICSGSPGIAAVNGRFQAFWREPGGGGVFCTSSSDGEKWDPTQFTYHAATDAVCPVAWDGKTMFFYAYVVNDSRKRATLEKLMHPDDAVRYCNRALAHGHWPADVELDASDHWPLMVDFL